MAARTTQRIFATHISATTDTAAVLAAEPAAAESLKSRRHTRERRRHTHGRAARRPNPTRERERERGCNSRCALRRRRSAPARVVVRIWANPVLFCGGPGVGHTGCSGLGGGGPWRAGVGGVRATYGIAVYVSRGYCVHSREGAVEVSVAFSVQSLLVWPWTPRRVGRAALVCPEKKS